jgi:hypothetical protein
MRSPWGSRILRACHARPLDKRHGHHRRRRPRDPGHELLLDALQVRAERMGTIVVMRDRKAFARTVRIPHERAAASRSGRAVRLAEVLQNRRPRRRERDG